MSILSPEETDPYYYGERRVAEERARIAAEKAEAEAAERRAAEEGMA